jgi:hypothetical protein
MKVTRFAFKFTVEGHTMCQSLISSGNENAVFPQLPEAKGIMMAEETLANDLRCSCRLHQNFAIELNFKERMWSYFNQFFLS